MLFYLMAIHPTALLEMEKRCIELEILPKNEQSLVKLPDSLERLQGGKLLELIQKTEDEALRHFLFDVVNNILADTHLNLEYSHYSEAKSVFEENRLIAPSDFPKA